MFFNDNDSILPGSLTEINVEEDYGYSSSLFGTTDTVLIIGTAFDGPVGEIVPIYSPDHARHVFGNIYNPVTKKEANLVAGIQDAYDKGCKTIYAFRISGKSLYKDFQLATETQYKIRVNSICPSNVNKDVYMYYNNVPGQEEIRIYKPAKKATSMEKMLGLVDSENSILVTKFDLANTYGFSSETSLTELIKILNEHKQNNVLRFGIVDKNGIDVTLSSMNARSLTIKDLMPGLYLIGRNTNKYNSRNTPISNIDYELQNDKIIKKLTINTDIAMDLPIYGTPQELSKVFNLAIDSSMRFLEVPGKIDSLFGKDNIDYEEVDLSKFDIYKRLGCGYAITTCIEEKNGRYTNPKETPLNNTNRVLPIQDGYYSTLQNFESKYRVVMCCNFDDKITGKMPRKKEFLEAFPTTRQLKSFLQIESKVNKDNLHCPKLYNFTINSCKSEDLIIKTDSISNTAMHLVGLKKENDDFNKTFENGSLFLEKTSEGFALKRYSNKKFIELTNDLLQNKYVFCNGKVYKGELSYKNANTIIRFKEYKINTKYITVINDEKLYLYKKDNDIFEPFGLLKDALKQEEDKTLIAIENVYGVNNNIVINSSSLDWTTLEEFVECLNEDNILSNMFKFTVIDGRYSSAYMTELFNFKNIKTYSSSLTYKVGDCVSYNDITYECIQEITKPEEFNSSKWTTINTITIEPKIENISDKKIDYNASKFIPYRTTDNFARQLAQHCAYTSYKTSPTHGIIGCNKILNTNLDNIAYKVNELCNIKYKLSAKKTNGNDMLNKDNMPYLIGNYISVPALFQYVMYDPNNNYTFISNGAAGYAGMISNLPLNQSSTNQSIKVTNTMFDLSNYQLKKLTSAGFITLTNSYTKGSVITDGITMAEPTSPFRRLQVIRIVAEVEEIIKTVTEPYVGQTNNLTNRNSMFTALKSAFNALLDKYINKIDFKLLVDPTNPQLGTINIDYNLVPIYEIKHIRNRITIVD